MSSNQYTEGIYLEDGTLKKFKDAELTTVVNQHTSNTSNPHSVTKSQVGLGNVENKSSETIRGELTKANVVAALGYTPIHSGDTLKATNIEYEAAENTSTSNVEGALTNIFQRIEANTDNLLSIYNVVKDILDLKFLFRSEGLVLKDGNDNTLITLENGFNSNNYGTRQVLNSYGNASCTATGQLNTTDNMLVPAFTTCNTINEYVVKSSNYKIIFKKPGLYIVQARIGVNSSNKRIDFYPYINGVRIAKHAGEIHSTGDRTEGYMRTMYIMITQSDIDAATIGAGASFCFCIKAIDVSTTATQVVNISDIIIYHIPLLDSSY